MKVRGGIVLAKAASVRPELGHRIPTFWPITRTTAYVANGNLGDMFFLRDAIADRKPRSPAAIARVIRNTLHDHAVRRDVRPLALQVLLGSVGEGRSSIAGFDVTGAQWECEAWALGHQSARARDRLIKAWSPSLIASGAESLVRRIYASTPHETFVLLAT